MDLEERAERVTTRQDMVEFLGALAADCKANAGGWDNSTLEAFLEAAAAWAHDMGGAYANRGERVEDQSPWRVITDILMAARIYE
jgi:hypothetical protein